MRCPHPTTIDFETGPIRSRPEYPPKPVGVSIKPWGKKATYYAFGHPSENTCSEAEAKAALAAVWGAGPLLFHNSKFDVDVAETHWGLPRLPWDQIHDTLFLLFLDDPHQKDMGLKPSAERLLGQPPEERDKVKDWLLGYQPLKPQGIRISESKGSENYWAAYICEAPGKLVGKYANGDTSRTEALFKLLWGRTNERQMLGAYDRERELMLVLLDNERGGMRVDLDKLDADICRYSHWMTTVDAWVVDYLKAPGDINLDSGQQLVAAMLAAGVADAKLMGTTDTGKTKSDKDALLAGVTDKNLLAMLNYRAHLKTCMNTFMRPWRDTAERSGGRIFTNWNQTRGDSGGTRTGRLSSTPNFQNIPKPFKLAIDGGSINAGLEGLPPLPVVRSYILPDEGHVLIDRDYSQQELRVLAHFEDGALLEAYKASPWMDVHDYVKAMVTQMTGKPFDRHLIKIANFGLIYGMGVALLAKQAGVDEAMAKEVKEAILALLPGLKDLYQSMRRRFMEGKPIRTWGGREYYCEAPRMVEGRMMTFDYKLVNYLVQGSSADCTKQAILEYSRTKPSGHRLLASVHDELLVSVPAEELVAGMEALRVAMEGIKFDVPMLSEGKWSVTSWASMVPYDKKGELCVNTK